MFSLICHVKERRLRNQGDLEGAERVRRRNPLNRDGCLTRALEHLPVASAIIENRHQQAGNLEQARRANRKNTLARSGNLTKLLEQIPGLKEGIFASHCAAGNLADAMRIFVRQGEKVQVYVPSISLILGHHRLEDLELHRLSLTSPSAVEMKTSIVKAIISLVCKYLAVDSQGIMSIETKERSKAFLREQINGWLQRKIKDGLNGLPAVIKKDLARGRRTLIEARRSDTWLGTFLRRLFASEERLIPEPVALLDKLPEVIREIAIRRTNADEMAQDVSRMQPPDISFKAFVSGLIFVSLAIFRGGMWVRSSALVVCSMLVFGRWAIRRGLCRCRDEVLENTPSVELIVPGNRLGEVLGLSHTYVHMQLLPSICFGGMLSWLLECMLWVGRNAMREGTTTIWIRLPRQADWLPEVGFALVVKTFGLHLQEIRAFIPNILLDAVLEAVRLKLQDQDLREHMGADAGRFQEPIQVVLSGLKVSWPEVTRLELDIQGFYTELTCPEDVSSGS
eukprot:TRINITY_DN47752_c0_g1_i1.p1 TRINITY_DN47752_c0_g1~~TRINITY_DN47752_c0_g1_i1.p1  ORF type:complete len:509 (-),score=45.00 TRINITY_DN47752_c0_g1_i1:61-1587(-)